MFKCSIILELATQQGPGISLEANLPEFSFSPQAYNTKYFNRDRKKTVGNALQVVIIIGCVLQFFVHCLIS